MAINPEWTPWQWVTAGQVNPPTSVDPKRALGTLTGIRFGAEEMTYTASERDSYFFLDACKPFFPNISPIKIPLTQFKGRVQYVAHGTYQLELSYQYKYTLGCLWSTFASFRVTPVLPDARPPSPVLDSSGGWVDETGNPVYLPDSGGAGSGAA